MPSSPQALESRSRVLEYDTNYYSTVEVMWVHPGNDSRIDFYHYLLFDGLTEVNASESVILESNTTNTTVIIDDNGVSILFVLSACNCKGTSDPVKLMVRANLIMHAWLQVDMYTLH